MTTEHILSAAAAIRKMRPTYADILSFYEPVFIAQETSASQVHLPAIPEHIKIRENLPLISVSDFIIDETAATKLFLEICRIASTIKTNQRLSEASVLLMRTIEREEFNISGAASQLLKENSFYFKELSDKYDVDAPILDFFVYHSIKPSIEIYSRQLSEHPAANRQWDKGCCPICGSDPSLSSLEGDGFRFLYCSFCGHRWNVSRLFCPFCENRDQKLLYYMYNDEEKEYRIDVCEGCKHYIKTVDTRNLLRPFYPPLEAAVTLHLDIEAGEEGLKTKKSAHRQI